MITRHANSISHSPIKAVITYSGEGCGTLGPRFSLHMQDDSLNERPIREIASFLNDALGKNGKKPTISEEMATAIAHDFSDFLLLKNDCYIYTGDERTEHEDKTTPFFQSGCKPPKSNRSANQTDTFVNNVTEAFTNDFAKVVFDSTSHFLKFINIQKTIVLAPGRSPYFHAIALELLGSHVFNFAFSSYAYCNGKIPSRSQIMAYRHYLKSIGLTPSVLYRPEQEVAILDVISSGGAVRSIIHLFSHWQYEETNGTTIPTEHWAQHATNFSAYNELAGKTKAFRLAHAMPIDPSNIPVKEVIELISASSMVNPFARLGANSFPVKIPHYSLLDWDRHPTELVDTNSRDYLEACRADQLMRTYCEEQIRTMTSRSSHLQNGHRSQSTFYAAPQQVQQPARQDFPEGKHGKDPKTPKL